MILLTCPPVNYISRIRYRTHFAMDATARGFDQQWCNIRLKCQSRLYHRLGKALARQRAQLAETKHSEC